MASSHQQGNGHLKFISNLPHFFKIILPDTIRDGKLGIPRKFVKDYGNGMSSPALLKVPTGAVWKVELIKCDGKIWLKNGWQEFSNHYSLDYGHFLVFRYEGNCNFHVVIFDRSASEIEYPFTCNNHRLSKEIDDSIQIIEDISSSRKMREKSQLPCPRPQKILRSTNSAIKTETNVKSEFLDQQFRHKGYPARKGDKSTNHHRIQQFKADEKIKALQRASSAFKSENPFFLVVMQPSYVDLGKKCRLAIPTNFVRKHLRKEHCYVILCNSNGKTWTVSFIRMKRFYGSLRNGWETFVQDNNIHVGDVCAFELINCIEISFKVVIYQGQMANCHESHALTDVFHPVKKNVRAPYPRHGYPKSLNAIEKAKAFQIVRAFRSENPYFVIVVQPSYVHAKLSVPENFARTYFKKMHKEVILLLSNGKSWPVKYYQHGIERPSAKLCTGWRRFAQDNNLEVGDVCVFELTESTETSLKVTIFKKQAAEDSNSGSSLADKSKENQVEHLKESLVIKTESDWVNNIGDMSRLYNQHPTEELPVPKIRENKSDATGEILDDISLFQEIQEEKSVSPSMVSEGASQRYQTLQENKAIQDTQE